MKKELSSKEFCKHVAKHVGNTLKLLRRQRGLTAKELSIELEISVQQLIKYEAGINRISLGRLLMVCNYFQYNITDFIQDICTSLDIAIDANKTSGKFPKLVNITKLSIAELNIINQLINTITKEK
jgi:transcriptional regulator with XRE-family HTH domain